MNVFTRINKAVRGLFGGNERPDQGKAGMVVPAGRKAGTDRADNDAEFEETVAGNYDAWDEIDDARRNFFLGGWANRRIRELNAIREQRKCEDLMKRQQAEQEGREYKSPLELEIEDAEKKREEKERLKEARRRQREVGRQDKRE